MQKCGQKNQLIIVIITTTIIIIINIITINVISEFLVY